MAAVNVPESCNSSDYSCLCSSNGYVDTVELCMEDEGCSSRDMSDFLNFCDQSVRRAVGDLVFDENERLLFRLLTLLHRLVTGRRPPVRQRQVGKTGSIRAVQAGVDGRFMRAGPPPPSTLLLRAADP